MHGETTHKLKQIAEDIKASWYFRFWLLSGIVLFFIGFSCLIILGARSTKADKDPNSIVWFESATSMIYPRFHFRVNNGMVITNVSCHHFLNIVPTGLCDLHHGIQPSFAECQAVYGETVEIVYNPEHEMFDMGISCNITTTGNDPLYGTMIAMSLEGENMIVGPDMTHSLWIAPTDEAWVLLTKGVSKLNKKTVVNDWTRKLVYQSTVSVPGFYHVRVIIEDFGIFHIDTEDVYNGWRAIGDIGGFAFALVLFHTAIMIIIGLCFYNNSSFLKKGEESGHSVPSGGEYQVINNK